MIKWADRSLVTSPIHMTLVKSQKEFDVACAYTGLPSHKVPDQWLGAYAHARVHFITGPEKAYAIVAINKKAGDKAQVLALLVHETVHIVDRIMELLGETPSPEFKAYTTQSVFEELYRML